MSTGICTLFHRKCQDCRLVSQKNIRKHLLFGIEFVYIYVLCDSMSRDIGMDWGLLAKKVGMSDATG
jgi:hypothetical protein